MQNSNEFEQNQPGQFQIYQNETPTDQTITPQEADVYNDDSSAVQGLADDEKSIPVLSNEEYQQIQHEQSKEAED